MNRFSVVGSVVLAASVAFSADNQWDGNDFNYDGAFGLLDGTSPDWSTATDIYTIRTPQGSDTPGGALGYLGLLNVENTTVTVTNSFTGKIYMNNFGGSPPFGSPAIVTNHIISVDEGVTVTGAASDNLGGATADTSPAVQIVSPSDDLIFLEEGKYVGGAGSVAVLMTGTPFATKGTLKVLGANIIGSDGPSFDALGGGSLSYGSVGIQQTSGYLIIDSQQRETDAIRGGNGGDDLFGNVVGTADAYGGDAISRFLFNNDLRMENGLVLGGSGGHVVSSGALDLKAYGGKGLLNGKGAAVINGGVIKGGNGGTAEVATLTDGSTAAGGTGVSLGSAATDSFIGAAEISGGKGGDVVTAGTANTLDISGGDALVILGSTATFTNEGAQVTGGAGGTLESSGSVDVDASGGDALAFGGSGAGGEVVILGGTYTGGIGGTVTDSTAVANVSGGRGLVITNGVTADISNNAVISGGMSGDLNGTVGNQAVAIEVNDATLIIDGATLSGSKGLLTTTSGSSNTVTVLSGDLGDVEFSGGDEYITLTGGTYNEILLSGTGTKELKLGGAATFNSGIVQDGLNTVELLEWSNGNLNGATISTGTLNVRNGDFVQGSGDSLTLIAEAAIINFDQDVQIAGELDVGLGSLSASNLTVKSGAKMKTALKADGAGIKVGSINIASGTIEDNVSWTVVNQDVTDSSLFDDGILLASATETDIVHSLEFEDFTLENNPEWLLGINGVTNEFDGSSYNLIATYGQLNLSKVFEDYPDLGPAMAQLGDIVANDPDLADYVASAWNDVQDAATDLGEGFVRTPEMANALIGLQSVFADQIKSRTRANLRYKNFGSKTAYAPSGPRGPEWYENSVQWTKDHLPSWDAQGDARKLDERAPKIDYDGEPSEVGKSYNSSTSSKGSDYKMATKDVQNRTPGVDEPIEVPETWQVWGGAYGSSLKQDNTTGHVGYRGTIVGGMIAMDKRFEKMLMGLGAGYARTTVDGNEGNDGDADTLHATAYWAHNSDAFYVDASLTYGYNDVSTEGVDTIGYEADYNAHTLGIGLGVGYGISFAKDKWLFTPEASYLGTMFNRGEYTEKSNLATPFPNKEYDSYDQWSHLTSIGATLSMIGVIESFRTELEYQPEFRLHWLHEFNADMEDDSYLLVGGTGDPIAVALQAREEDLIRIGTGIRFSEWGNDTTEFSLDLDGAIGADYHNYIVSGKILHRF